MKCRQVTNLSCHHYDVNQVAGNRATVANQDHDHRDIYNISTQVHMIILTRPCPLQSLSSALSGSDCVLFQNGMDMENGES